MPTIDDIRARFPEWMGDDNEVLDALHRNYYADVPRAEVERFFGYTPAKQMPKPAERTLMGTLGDVGLSALKGAIAVPEAAVGLADMVSGGRAGQALEAAGFRPKEAKAYLDQFYSDAQKQANAAFAQADGLGEVLKAGLENPSVVGHAVVESAPSMLGGGVVGRGAMAVAPRLGAVGAGALGEGVMAAGAAGEQIRQQTEDGLLSGGQAAAALGTGVATAGLSRLGGAVAKRLGINDVDSLLVQAAKDPARAKGVVRAALEGALSEGLLEELPQSVSEQVIQNLALGKPLEEGVTHAAVLGTLAGGAMGAGANLVSRPGGAGEGSAPEASAVGPGVGPTTGAPHVAPTPPAGALTRAAQAVTTAPVATEPMALAPSPSITGADAATMLETQSTRADPLAESLTHRVEAPSLSHANLVGMADKRPPMTASQAARILEAAREQGHDFVPAPHPDGGFLVMPRQWVTPDVARAAKATLESTLQNVAKAASEPVVRAERSNTDAVELDLPRDAVDGYLQTLKDENTPAARAFLGELAAGRLGREDVVARMEATQPTDPDQRLARAAAEGKQRADDPVGARLARAAQEGAKLAPTQDIVHPVTGKPFTIKPAAQKAAQAAGPGHEVVRVDSGYVVRREASAVASPSAPVAQDAAVHPWDSASPEDRTAWAQRSGMAKLQASRLAGKAWSEIKPQAQARLQGLAPDEMPSKVVPTQGAEVRPVATAREFPSAEGSDGAPEVSPSQASDGIARITSAAVQQAQQEAAALIAQRIDAMPAVEVNALAWRFLPTMGMKPTHIKARNKAMLMDPKGNLEASAAELGVELPKSVTDAWVAEMEGRVSEEVELTFAEMIQKGRDDFAQGVDRQEGQLATASHMRRRWLSGWEEAKDDADAKAVGKIAVPSDFPTQEVAVSYSGISHSADARARADRDAYVDRVQSLYEGAQALAETQAQREALDEAIHTYQQEYIAQTRALMNVRAGTYSGFVAGGGNINTRQADRRNSALDRAIERFGQWESTAAPKVKEAVLSARTPEQVAQLQAEAEEKRATKQAEKLSKDKALMRKILAFKPGDDLKFGPVFVTKVSNDKEGYPLALKLKASDGSPLMDDRLDLSTEVFGRKGQQGGQEGRAKIRELVDAIRAESTDKMGDGSASPSAQSAASSSTAKPVTKTPTVDRHMDVMEAVRKGSGDLAAYKASFAAIHGAEEAVKAELATKTKDDLLRAAGPYFAMRYRNEPKAEIIRAFYADLLDEYALGKGYGPNSYVMSSGGLAAHQKLKREALAALVDAQTDEGLKAFADEVASQRAEVKAKREAQAQAMENPQSLEDFRAVLRRHMGEGKTLKEAFLMLTPVQRAAYDALEAESTRESREARKRTQRTEVRAAGQHTGGQIVATRHTRDGHELFVVQLADRLSAEDYKTVLSSAKRLGGWYSSFRGQGAVPGFQFKDKASAEAFLKLAAGDTTDAQAQVEQRRDAFEDDRSQTAAQRLNEMADRMDQAAEDELGRDRKTNTLRRARFATAALNAAESQKALAQTMRNMAQAIESGNAKFLDAVRTKVQVEALNGYVRTAQDAELRAKHDSYLEQERRKGQPPTSETADYAEFPAFTAYRSDLASLARKMLEVDGTKKLGQQLMKVADDVTDAYLAFAKEPAHLFKLSSFSMRRGDEVRAATFPNKDAAERAIRRSGLVGQAMVLPEKRGVNRIIMSPSEAINAGIWTGDGDKRITLTAEYANELVEAIGRRGGKRNGLEVPWQLQTAHDRRKQLAKMGIETPSEFRSALREFIALREHAQSNKVRELELKMVGRKADGLDFFPTPAEVADQMVAAADLAAGMRVLEPSAGMGHIADRIRAAGTEPEVGEVSPERRELLEEKGYRVVAEDFLGFTAALERGFTYGDLMRAPDGAVGILRGQGGLGSDRVRLVSDEAEPRTLGFYNFSELEGVERRGVDSGYDRILMNPPFSQRRDAEHVRHAYDLLKPGGRLVAIMGEGVFFGQDKKAQDFRDWLDAVGGTSEKLPAGSFMDPSLPVNTGVSARLVVIDKAEGEAATFSRSPMKSVDANVRRGMDALAKALDERTTVHRAMFRNGLGWVDFVFGDAGTVKSSGRTKGAMGLVHIIEARQRKDGMSEAQTLSLLEGIVGAIASGAEFDRAEVGNTTRVGLEYGDTIVWLTRRQGSNAWVVTAYEKNPDGANAGRATSAPTSPAASLTRDRRVAGFAEIVRAHARGVNPVQFSAATPTHAESDGLAKAQASGLPPAFVNKLAQGIRARWAQAPEVRVVASMEDPAIPQEVKDHDQRKRSVGAAGDPEGFIYQGVVYLVADQLAAPEDVVRVLFHEVLGHAGLRGVYGDKLTPLLNQLALARPQEIKAKALQYGLDLKVRAERLEAAEEVLAEMAQGLPQIGFVRRAVGLIRGWLRTHVPGFAGMRMSDEEIIARFLMPARAYIERGGRGGGMRAGGQPRLSRKALEAGDEAQGFAVTDLKAMAGYKLADLRGLGLQMLGRRQLVDIYGDELPSLKAYNNVVQQMDAEKNESGAEADALAQTWGKLKDEGALADLMHDATLAQLDPDKRLSAGDDEAQYQALRARFDALSAEAQAVYRQAREMYADHFAKVRSAIAGRIERSNLAKEQRAKLLERMDGEFFGKTKGVYFPLARFGSYVLAVKDAEGGVVGVHRAETMAEAQKLRAALLRRFPTGKGFAVSKVLKSAEFNASREGVGRGFLEDLFRLLDASGVGAELQDAVNQLYLTSLPDLSWAKHGIHRKGTPGFSQDARRAFAQNMFHGARHLAKLRYGDQLQRFLEDADEHIAALRADASYDEARARDVLDEMIKRHELLMNPKTNSVSTALTSVGFVFHMGLSPASAITNLSGVPLMSFPMLGAKFGGAKAFTTLLGTSRQVAASGNDLGKALEGDELLAFERAVRDGTIDVTQAHDLAGIAQGEDAKVAWAMRPVMRWASLLFHHAERFNRQVTFMGAYRLSRAAGQDHDAAFDAARKMVNDSQFDYGSSNRPRFMQGNMARVVLLFKQYGQNMIYTLGRQAYLSLKGLSPQERSEARKTLGGILTMHALAAGALGLPLVGPLLALASFLGGSEDEPWDAEVALRNLLAQAVGHKPAEVMSRGLSRLTPWDVSGRVGLDKLIFPDVQEGLEGARWYESMATGLLGPVAGIGLSAAKGLQEIAEGHWARGLETMAPAALRGPLKALRYQNEGAIDKTGVPILQEVGLAGVVGQALGLAPSEVRLAMEGKSAVRELDARVEHRRGALLRHYSEAAMRQDQEAMRDVLDEVRAFNKKQPQRAIVPRQLFASVAARRRRAQESEQGVFLPKSRRYALGQGVFAIKPDEVHELKFE